MMTFLSELEQLSSKCLRLADLPLLSSIVQSNEDRQPLKNYVVLNIQHQLGDVTGQVEGLIVLGVQPDDLYFLPPAYTHHREFEAFVQKNFHVPRENFFQASTYRLKFDYDKHRLSQVIDSFYRMINRDKPVDRLLVLDDGGCFSEALVTLVEKGEAEKLRSIDIRLVEQTSRGIFKYFDQPRIGQVLRELGIFLVDVARSEPKKRLEPPLVAEASINMLNYLFHAAPSHLKLPSRLSKDHRCLLLGYGAIGRAIAQALTQNDQLGYFSRSSLMIFDIDSTQIELAKNDGFEIFDRWDENDQFDLIIGCAGRCSFPLHRLSLLRNNAFLISVSSAAIEFPFHQLVENSLSNQFDVLQQLNDENIHRNIQFTKSNGDVFTIVNGGMPVTFLGLLNPIVPEKFDVTVSSMIAGSIQSVSLERQFTSEDRIVSLNSDFSERICRHFDQ